MKFSFKDFFSNRPNRQFPADLVTFTEQILNGKRHVLCSLNHWRTEYLLVFVSPSPALSFSESYKSILSKQYIYCSLNIRIFLTSTLHKD